jgi:hypothetical protein
MSDGSGRASGLSRREALAGLVAGGIGAVAIPVQAGHPVEHHLASPGTVGSAHAAVAAGDWVPAFLSPHQHETLAAFSERLIPGASRTHASRFVDKLLDVDSQDAQKRFLESLSAFEAASMRQFGRPFLKLATSEQDQVLTVAAEDEARLGDDLGWGWFGARGSSSEPGLDLGRHLRHLKGWVSGAYYSSEIGLKELGWTGNMAFESWPGCTHGGHP